MNFKIIIIVDDEVLRIEVPSDVAEVHVFGYGAKEEEHDEQPKAKKRATTSRWKKCEVFDNPMLAASPPTFAHVNSHLIAKEPLEIFKITPKFIESVVEFTNIYAL